jgi:hypothetical protein
MKYRYIYWDFEKSQFIGELYDTIGCFYLYDHPYKTWDEFEADLPHMAYTHVVSSRFKYLEDLFIDLRVVVQMLGVEDFPIKSKVRDIDRYQWLKSAIDLKLMRYASIRDTCFHYVNEIFEFNLKGFDLNLKKLKGLLKNSHPTVIALLEKVNAAGSNLRTRRNDRAHRGLVHEFTSDDSIFRFISQAESLRVISQDGSGVSGFDLLGEHKKACDQIYRELVREVNALLKIVLSLLDELSDQFFDRYEEKYKRSPKYKRNLAAQNKPVQGTKA